MYVSVSTKSPRFPLWLLIALGLAALLPSLKAATVATYIKWHVKAGSAGCCMYYKLGGGAVGLPQDASRCETTASGTITQYIGAKNVGDSYTVYSRASALSGTGSTTPWNSMYTFAVGAGDGTSFITPEQELDAAYTTPLPNWCITLGQTNNTAYRQRYAVYNSSTLVKLVESAWVNPGVSWSWSYCAASKIPLQIARLTDSDPPVTDYSRDIATSDGAWIQDDVGGFNGGADATGLGGPAPTGGIDWVVDTTAASEGSLRKGFEILYNTDRNGFDKLLLAQQAASAKIATVTTTVGAGNTALGTLNTTLNSARTDLSDLGTKLTTINTTLSAGGGQATAANQVTANANQVNTTAAINSAASTASTKSDIVNASVQGAMSAVQAGTTAANTGAANARTDAQANGTRLDTLHTDAGALQAGLNALLAKEEEVRQAVTNNKPDHLEKKTESELESLADSFKAVGVAAATPTANDYTGLAATLSSRSDVVPGGGGAWMIPILAIDCNPMNDANFASVASWTRQLLTWCSYAALLFFVVKKAKEAIASSGSFTQTQGAAVSVLGNGSTLPLGIICFVIIAASLVTVGGFFITWYSSNSTIGTILAGTPWQTGNPMIMKGVWLTDQFVPLVTTVANFFLAVTFTLSLTAALFLNQMIVRAMISGVVLCFILREAEALPVTLFNGSEHAVSVKLGQAAYPDAVGVVVPAGAGREFDIDDGEAFSESYEAQFLAISWKETNGVWSVSEGPVFTTYEIEAGKAINITMMEGDTENPWPMVRSFEVYWLPAHWFFVGLKLGIGFLSAALCVNMVRKIGNLGDNSDL